MPSRLRPGIVAVITGAGSGIGRATALRLASQGARLVLGDLHGQLVEEVATRCSERGAEALGIRCDVRSEDDVDRLFETARERFGPVGVLVANAGLGYYARVEDTPTEDFRHLLDVNVLGVHRCIQRAVPIMREQGAGHIVVVGSVNGKLSWPYHGAYSATKFALTGLAQALRMELSESGVTCTLVLPLNVNTGFFASAEVGTNGYSPRPIGRMRSARSVANAIVRSIDHPAPEINLARSFRVSSTIAEACPWVVSAAGGRWYRRHRPEP